MFKKATFALAGALAMAAAAAIPATAGAADDSAPNEVTFYPLIDFGGIPKTAFAGACTDAPTGANPVKSAKLRDTAVQVALYSTTADEGCSEQALITVLNVAHSEDSGNLLTGGTPTLGNPGARSFKLV